MNPGEERGRRAVDPGQSAPHHLVATPFDRLIPVVGRPLDTKARVVPIEASVESGGQSGSGIQNERPDERCGAIARLV